MKAEHNKIFDNNQIIVIGLSKSLITCAVYDRDIVYTFNLGLVGDRERFENLAEKYGITGEELYHIKMRAFLMFD